MACSLDPEEAAMYHFRTKLSNSGDFFKTPHTTPSEYASAFFPQVRGGDRQHRERELPF